MVWRATVYRCGAIHDAAGTKARPGAVAVREGKVLAAGTPDQVLSHQLGQVITVDLPRTLILPAMVNAHVHLDLTSVGPVEYPGDFIDWLRMVMGHKAQQSEAIATSVKHGAEMSRQAGVRFIGDIAGSSAALAALRETALAGTAFLEVLGGRALGAQRNIGWVRKLLGRQSSSCAERMLHLGISPHAPYSTELELFAQSVELARQYGCTLCTHLAETPAELRYVADGEGPFVDLLHSLGKSDQVIVPTGLHPVDWLEPLLLRGRWLLAHCNYMDDEHIELLSRHDSSVAYCPIASDYFGHRGHRYRDMLAAGVNICLGTDSILCQPPQEPQPLGILPQMRHLYRRDRADPDLLLAMATVSGLRALGLDQSLATLRSEAPANFIGVRFDPDNPADPFTQVLQNRYPVEPITTMETKI